jgi:hypothetical protein
MPWHTKERAWVVIGPYGWPLAWNGEGGYYEAMRGLGELFHDRTDAEYVAAGEREGYQRLSDPHYHELAKQIHIVAVAERIAPDGSSIGVEVLKWSERIYRKTGYYPSEKEIKAYLAELRA